jgi:hypothetical protein
VQHQDDEQLDRELDARWREFVAVIDASLDVEAGLAAALSQAREGELINRLGDVLDVEAGLRAALKPYGLSEPPHVEGAHRSSELADARPSSADPQRDTALPPSGGRRCSRHGWYSRALASRQHRRLERSRARLTLARRKAHGLASVNDVIHDLTRLVRVLRLTFLFATLNPSKWRRHTRAIQMLNSLDDSLGKRTATFKDAMSTIRLAEQEVQLESYRVTKHYSAGFGDGGNAALNYEYRRTPPYLAVQVSAAAVATIASWTTFSAELSAVTQVLATLVILAFLVAAYIWWSIVRTAYDAIDHYFQLLRTKVARLFEASDDFSPANHHV